MAVSGELEALRQRAERAEADAAALGVAVAELAAMFRSHGNGGEMIAAGLEKFLPSQHVGSALLAELEAARPIVEFAREEWSTSTDLRKMLHRYDKVRKA